MEKKIRLAQFLGAAIGLLFVGAVVCPGATLAPLYTFTGGDDGGSPAGLMQDTNGYFYGTTVNGGTNDWGGVFRLTTAGTILPLYSFTGGTDGANPYAGLVLGTNGDFYGTTQSGGTNLSGAIFQITPNGAFTRVYSFAKARDNKALVITNADGDRPSFALVEGTNGNLYGTTEEGGANGFGVIFDLTYKGKLTVLDSLTNNVQGATPYGSLLSSGGNFYGTTTAGGSNSYGTIFEMSSAGQLTSLYSFTNGYDGANPEGSLIKGADGNFYGAATAGGSNGTGTIFQITPAGKLTPWYSFSPVSPASPYYNPDGATPMVLIQGTDGNFYGTAYNGGANGTGTIFELTAGKVFTTLYSFTALNAAYNNTNEDGANPVTLLQGLDGNFYGTAYNGGAEGVGVFFRIGMAPSITTQPASLLVGWHSNATFTVAATGATALQWQLDNTNLPLATNYTLSLTNVQPINAGYYQVILTNLNGAVTSSVVSLSVSNVPISFATSGGNIQLAGGQFLVTVTNLTGQGSIILDASTNLKQWIPILTNPPAFAPIQMIDSNAANYPDRFYRAVIGP